MPQAYPPKSAFGLQTVLLPDVLACSAFSLTPGSAMLNYLLKYLVWVDPLASAWARCRSVDDRSHPLWWQGKPLWRAQPIGHIQGELLWAPNFSHRSQAAWNVPWDTPPPGRPSPGPVSLVSIPSQPRAGWHCHLFTTEEVRAAEPAAQHRWGQDNEQTFQGRAALFSPPFLIA